MKQWILSFSVLSLVAGFSSAGLAQKAPYNESLPTLKLSDPLPQNLFVELGRVINPTVVNISSTVMPHQRGGMGRYQNDPLFQMLERFYGPGFQMQQAKPATSLGTGFIIREDGLIVTNNHVVEGADSINVQLNEKEKTYEATVVGRDSRTDIALIRIKPDRKISAAPLGSSKDVQVGEWVAAFGNPYGHGHTMTKGIVSAKGREIGELNAFPFIQTDASINPGNSGGPLVNSKGQVIGVNTAIDARAQGIGFAIPIDEVKSILPQLETKGKIKRGYIGIYMGELSPDAASYLGLPEDLGGVVVTEVEPGGPADKAGLKKYDIIVEVNGKKVQTSMDLANDIQDIPIGQNASVKLLRDGKEKSFKVPVSDRRETNDVATIENKKFKGGEKSGDLGISVGELTTAMANEIGAPKNLLGKPVVTDVQKGSLGERLGLRPGDVILDVNKKPMGSAQDVLKSLKKGSNSLRVARDGQFIFLAFETR